MTFKIKAMIAVAAASAFLAVGWNARGWLEDSKDLAAMKAQQSLVDEIREGQRQVSKQVEQRLSELRANERVIDRGVIREIEKPVYRNVCIPPGGDAFRLLNDAASGKAPGEPNDQVPQGTAVAN